jgi:hypothetical protein
MCPFCYETLGLIMAATVSTGGLAALGIKASRKKNFAAETNSNDSNAIERSNENEEK